MEIIPAFTSCDEKQQQQHWPQYQHQHQHASFLYPWKLIRLMKYIEIFLKTLKTNTKPWARNPINSWPLFSFYIFQCLNWIWIWISKSKKEEDFNWFQFSMPLQMIRSWRKNRNYLQSHFQFHLHVFGSFDSQKIKVRMNMMTILIENLFHKKNRNFTFSFPFFSIRSGQTAMS